MSRPAGAGPFAVLGLPARQGLDDDEVRSAWRRIAAATHPDRADGGDPAAFAEAAAAYTLLRTAFGRGEALADLAGEEEVRGKPPRTWRPARRYRAPWLPVPWRWAPPLPVSWRWLPWRLATAPARAASRAWRGRPLRLGLRLAAVTAVSVTAAVVDGPGPATPALITGALTWLLLTARHDCAPPHRRGGSGRRLTGPATPWPRGRRDRADRGG